ncbi:MAG: hypothetical protein R3F11_27825 [Verrucomicrobiales bacterium]
MPSSNGSAKFRAPGVPPSGVFQARIGALAGQVRVPPGERNAGAVGRDR